MADPLEVTNTLVNQPVNYIKNNPYRWKWIGKWDSDTFKKDFYDDEITGLPQYDLKCGEGVIVLDNLPIIGCNNSPPTPPVPSKKCKINIEFSWFYRQENGDHPFSFMNNTYWYDPYYDFYGMNPNIATFLLNSDFQYYRTYEVDYNKSTQIDIDIEKILYKEHHIFPLLMYLSNVYDSNARTYDPTFEIIDNIDDPSYLTIIDDEYYDYNNYDFVGDNIQIFRNYKDQYYRDRDTYDKMIFNRFLTSTVISGNRTYKTIRKAKDVPSYDTASATQEYTDQLSSDDILTILKRTSYSLKNYNKITGSGAIYDNPEELTSLRYWDAISSRRYATTYVGTTTIMWDENDINNFTFLHLLHELNYRCYMYRASSNVTVYSSRYDIIDHLQNGLGYDYADYLEAPSNPTHESPWRYVSYNFYWFGSGNVPYIDPDNAILSSTTANLIGYIDNNEVRFLYENPPQNIYTSNEQQIKTVKITGEMYLENGILYTGDIYSSTPPITTSGNNNLYKKIENSMGAFHLNASTMPFFGNKYYVLMYLSYMKKYKSIIENYCNAYDNFISDSIESISYTTTFDEDVFVSNTKKLSYWSGTEYKTYQAPNPSKEIHFVCPTQERQLLEYTIQTEPLSNDIERVYYNLADEIEYPKVSISVNPKDENVEEYTIEILMLGLLTPGMPEVEV